MSTPTPPAEFKSWLDYAIATMSTRGAYLDRDVQDAAQEELNHLKQRAVMPWIGMLDNWQVALSKRLGRSAEDIFEGNLLATDFSNDSVHVQFEDGTDLTFRRAFYVGDTTADGAIHRVAVFTEHCGYHEFWIGPNDRIAAAKVVPADEYKKDETHQRGVVEGGGIEEILTMYSLGKIPRLSAMQRIGVTDYGLLLRLLNAAGLPHPTIKERDRRKLDQAFDAFFDQSGPDAG